jgi:hypothetical protein
MAGIERDVSQVVQSPDYGASLISGIISRIKSLTFTPVSLYPIVALSVVLIIVITGLRYEKAASNDNPGLPLANARVIKAENIDKMVLKVEADKDDLSYYLSRHEAKAYRPSGRPIAGKAKLVYISYNAGNR